MLADDFDEVVLLILQNAADREAVLGKNSTTFSIAPSKHTLIFQSR